MSDAVFLLIVVVATVYAVVLFRVVLGVARACWTPHARVHRLRRHRQRRAEAMAAVLDDVEAMTADAPDDLAAALESFGPEWKAEHRSYALAARALATEFRTLRNARPDPKVDVASVQHELRMMLKARKCRNKDAIRIVPLALVMCFYKSEYEQTVEHAFAQPVMRERLMVAQDDPLEPTWVERWFGGYRNPVPTVA